MSSNSEKFKVIIVSGDSRRGVHLPTNIRYAGLYKYVAKKFSLQGGFSLSYKLVPDEHSLDITDDDEVSYFISECVEAKQHVPMLFVTYSYGNQGNASFLPTQNSDFTQHANPFQNQDFTQHDDPYPNSNFTDHVDPFQNSEYYTKNFETPLKYKYDFTNTDSTSGSGNVAMDWQKNTFSFMPEPPTDPVPEIKEPKPRNYDSTAVVESNQWFENKRECKLYIAKKAIEEGFEFKVRKSDKCRYDVVCMYPECGWKIICNRVYNGNAFVTGTVNDIHTCPKTQTHPTHRNANSEVLGHLLKDQFTDSSRVYKGKDIQQDINKNYKIQISYQQAWRGKAQALQMLQGSPKDSFLKLPYYLHNLKLKNPGSVAHIETDEHGQFEMLFVAIGVAVRSFVHHLRPVIIIDGAHLKGQYEGTNLQAVGMDGNNQILPIAYGVCKGETGEAWTWFLTKLRECIGQDSDLVIISDRHASISLAVRDVFPNAFHGICCHHLEANVKLKRNDQIHGMYWKICKAYTVLEFNRLMTQLHGLQPESVRALVDADVSRWSRAHCPKNRWAYLTSNSAESMNSVTRNDRKLPITQLIEYFRSMVQRWYYERHIKAEQLQQNLTEWAARKVEKRVRKTATWKAYGISDTDYQVNDGQNVYLIDLRNGTCSCRKWQLSGIPCAHVIFKKHKTYLSSNIS